MSITEPCIRFLVGATQAEAHQVVGCAHRNALWTVSRCGWLEHTLPKWHATTDVPATMK